MIRSQIAGVGAYLPERVVTNYDLEKILDTSHEWILERSGISERRFAADGELTSDLALKAAKAALRHADVDPTEIDVLIVGTTTPDQTFPATATKVQAELGCVGGPAFDLQAVCSGFIYGLATADNFIRAGQAKTALVIGAETISRLLDWQDRTTSVLFGDGAGAVVLKAGEGEGHAQDRGILAVKLHADGTKGDLLYVDGGPSSTRTTGYLRMKGREVFRHAVMNMAAVVEETVVAAGVTSSQIDWLVPHQANRRILDSTAAKLGLAPEKLVATIDRHGNTSAASVPLALAEAVADGRIKPGDLVMMEAMGGGFTWGAAAVRW